MTATSGAARAARQFPLIMGVINLTPDSFSDGGEWSNPGAAIARMEQLLADGADLIDLGAESTRPGACSINEDEEWSRLAPVLKLLARHSLLPGISIDTRKPTLMLRAAEYGATWYNDVGGQATHRDLQIFADYPHSQYIAMHMPMNPAIMQDNPLSSTAALTSVLKFFDERMNVATAAGFSADRIWLDPGIGFGKTDAANLRLIAEIANWSKTRQIAVGISRKSFIGRTLNISSPRDRDPPSKMLELGLAMQGAKLIRTHDVKRLRAIADLLRGDASD